MKKIITPAVREKVSGSNTLLEFLTCDVSLSSLEQRKRVCLPRGATRAENRVVAPTDDCWQLYRAADGRAYYVQKEAKYWHKPPWKKTESVKLTPLDAIAWCADGDGDLKGIPQMRRDALRQLKQDKAKPVEPKVHLVFSVTGGGTEKLLGVFSSLTDAKAEAANESKKGRTAFVSTEKIQ